MLKIEKTHLNLLNFIIFLSDYCFKYLSIPQNASMTAEAKHQNKI